MNAKKRCMIITRVYDPVSDAMVIETEHIECPMSYSANSFSVARLRDKVYVIGGCDNMMMEYLADVWVLDLVSREWHCLGDNEGKEDEISDGTWIPAFLDQVAFVADDTLYVLGIRENPYGPCMYVFVPEGEFGREAEWGAIKEPGSVPQSVSLADTMKRCSAPIVAVLGTNVHLFSVVGATVANCFQRSVAHFVYTPGDPNALTGPVVHSKPIVFGKTGGTICREYPNLPPDVVQDASVLAASSHHVVVFNNKTHQDECAICYSDVSGECVEMCVCNRSFDYVCMMADGVALGVDSDNRLVVMDVVLPGGDGCGAIE
ncbi:hypothetical protein KIPB_003640 [Kipferlia bialata]|uniref:Uncharacterized protein n=1 Tax=Kipferlia bialata TaxID=797122 RepID=A0A9K3CVR8_9EUKA|nr:hypothetical protein KIPB_003640 [Kipferlia bialata]|eukprot:g3640.t1